MKINEITELQATPRISSEVFQHIEKVLGQLVSRYPAVGAFITRVVFPNSVTSEFDAFSRELRISNAGLSGTVTDADHWYDHANPPGFMIGRGLKSLIIHEFGHAIDHYIIALSDQDGKTAWFQRKKQLEQEIPPNSGYGRKNTREWFAEQFVAEYEGHARPVLLQLIDEFINR